MRLWTLDPRHLDAKGLVALWREGLLARKVLAGRTVGYRHHPQLSRFRAHPDPLAAIDTYLDHVEREADRRGYAFDRRKLGRRRTSRRIAETSGQVAVEWAHLRRKLRARDADAWRRARSTGGPAVHPLFRVVAGAARAWEKSSTRKRSGARVRGSRGSPSRRPTSAKR